MNTISHKSLTFTGLKKKEEGSLWGSQGIVFSSDISVINVNTEERMLFRFTAGVMNWQINQQTRCMHITFESKNKNKDFSQVPVLYYWEPQIRREPPTSRSLQSHGDDTIRQKDQTSLLTF